MDPEEKIKRLAYEAGFDLCGIASLASPPEALKELKTWLALGRQADVGAIAVGRYGDLIAVSGDPLADVARLQAVVFVMKGGEIIKAAAN